MKKKSLWLQSLLFLSFLSLFFLLHLILPDHGFSEKENRVLQTAPKFTLSSLFSGKFTAAYEEYVTDQFAFRDSWIALKARSELLCGKSENNGIYLCGDERLIEAFSAPDLDDLKFSLDAVNLLCNHTDADVYFALIPSASEIYADMLPYGAPNSSQKDVIDYAYHYVNAHSIDLYSALYAHRSEDIFYHTDHHWTTLGAYYGYAAISEALGMEVIPLADYHANKVSDSFWGTTYSSSGFHWVSPDTITTFVQQNDVMITNFPAGTPQEGTLYDESFLSVKDKYSYFYGGNTPLLEIETGNDAAPSVLIIRDSYMDSLSPFFFPHFSSISIVDLRYYKTSLQSYMEQNVFDIVLVCYSVPNICTDDSVFFAGR